jgi:large subunit ribosomal protein L17
MRHAVAGYKLNRDSEHRIAMRRNLAAALFQHGQITTTLPKAKSVQPLVEKLITLAKTGTLHARRLALRQLGADRELVFVVKGGAEPEQVYDKTLLQKLFEEIGPRYKDRAGGYTRIVKLARHRIGDGTTLCVLQLVGEEVEGGSKVKPRFSRRRQMQDNRTAYAAKLRKAKAQGSEAAAPAAEAAQPEAQGQ